MRGTVFKRCGSCNRRVTQRLCEHCEASTVSWGYRLKVAKKPGGTWQEQWKFGFPTKGAANDALAKQQAAIRENRHVVPSTMTVEDYLTTVGLEATKPPRVRPQTWNDRAAKIRLHVAPHLGHLRLQELTPGDLTELYNHLLIDGNQRDGGGLSVTSVRSLHRILRKAFNDAMRWGHLPHNPTALADPPPAANERASRRRSMKIWTPEQLGTFLAATEGQPHHVLWSLAAFTGMRRSELLALAWNEVRLDTGRIHVRASMVTEPDGTYVRSHELKSATSARTIELDPDTVQLLVQHRADTRPLHNPLDLVFPGTAGDGWLSPPAISIAFRRAVRSVDVPIVRFHDLRHTHASLLLQSRVNPKVVSERLGHSSVAFTLDTYAHVLPGMQADAATQLRALVRDGRTTSTATPMTERNA
ncbi:tyrosine-type recombinase/integrase [Euzebya rosea]|uniref:tyrosine-type recombinase/integrase n=1 Tax=Euzebya rosea TaxID=2052804 RepID=UPI000D3EDC79|nr:tyrosine-type recombinase/integrase [Euzebya rosea]